jgi:hypothetical protein
MKRRTLITILVILVAGAAFFLATWLYVFRTDKPNMQKLTTDYRLGAAGLLKEFQDDETVSVTKYAGKILEVRGAVNSIEKNEWGNVTVTYIDPLFGVTCTIDSPDAARDSAVISAIKAGDSLTVKGRCDGMLTDVKLVRCIILK